MKQCLLFYCWLSLHQLKEALKLSMLPSVSFYSIVQDHNSRPTPSLGQASNLFSVSSTWIRSVCVCVWEYVYVSHTHPPPLGYVYVCGQGVVGSGNLQSAALVPESSVTARLRPISTLDLIVFRKGAGPAVSFTSCDRCCIKAFSTEEW